MTRNRRADWRRVKGRLPYTVGDAASALGTCRGTIRHWIKKGLPVLTDRRPHLILGRDLVTFLKARRAARKSKCGPGELYCLKCRAPRKPITGLLELKPIAPGRSVLVGMCGQCERLLRRFVSDQRAEAVAAEFGVQLEDHHGSLADSANPSPSYHSERQDRP